MRQVLGRLSSSSKRPKGTGLGPCFSRTAQTGFYPAMPTCLLAYASNKHCFIGFSSKSTMTCYRDILTYVADRPVFLTWWRNEKLERNYLEIFYRKKLGTSENAGTLKNQHTPTAAMYVLLFCYKSTNPDGCRDRSKCPFRPLHGFVLSSPLPGFPHKNRKIELLQEMPNA